MSLAACFCASARTENDAQQARKKCVCDGRTGLKRIGEYQDTYTRGACTLTAPAAGCHQTPLSDAAPLSGAWRRVHGCLGRPPATRGARPREPCRGGVGWGRRPRPPPNTPQFVPGDHALLGLPEASWPLAIFSHLQLPTGYSNMSWLPHALSLGPNASVQEVVCCQPETIQMYCARIMG